MRSAYYRFLNHYQGSYTGRIIDEAIILLIQLWPYLVAGIVLTTLIKLYFSKDRLSLFFRNKENFSIPLASLLGVVSPLGSYIVIPLSAALYTGGVPLPFLMAFLVSSPLINPNLFLLTQGAFGFEMAIARVIAAFLLGLVAGYLTAFLIKRNKINLIIDPEYLNNSRMVKNYAEKPFWQKFSRELVSMTMFVGKYFFLAVILAAMIKILTPPNLMIRIFNGNNFLSVLFATGAGIPFYVCGGASIPLMMELADLGLSKGSVLAFFIAGPVTKVSNLILMYSIFKKQIFLIYLSLGVMGAILAGLIFDMI